MGGSRLRRRRSGVVPVNSGYDFTIERRGVRLGSRRRHSWRGAYARNPSIPGSSDSMRLASTPWRIGCRIAIRCLVHPGYLAASSATNFPME